MPPDDVKIRGRVELDLRREISDFEDRGALVTGYKDTARVAFQPLWNLVGRPALMLPWGRDADGLPTAVQFGAPPGGERALVALAAWLERERGRPPRPPITEISDVPMKERP